MKSIEEILHYRTTAADAALEAAKTGLIVDYPDDYTLQLDIDTEDGLARLKDYLPMVESLCKQLVPPNKFTANAVSGFDGWCGTLLPRITLSKSGNKHVRITLPISVGPLERIALQAMLGSDPKREILSVFALRDGETTPTVLFEKPDYESTVIAASKPVESVTVGSFDSYSGYYFRRVVQTSVLIPYCAAALLVDAVLKVWDTTE